MPPVMRYADRGIMNEITVLLPEVTMHLTRLIERSESSGFLNLTLMGLRDLPLAVLKMKNLRKLRLDFNDQLKLSLGFPKNEMKDLRTLSLKACKLTDIPESIKNLKSLTQLNMEDNCLTVLPDAFVRLYSLTHLGKTHTNATIATITNERTHIRVYILFAHTHSPNRHQ
jgi:hypothetical protein